MLCWRLILESDLCFCWYRTESRCCNLSRIEWFGRLWGNSPPVNMNSCINISISTCSLTSVSRGLCSLDWSCVLRVRVLFPECRSLTYMVLVRASIDSERSVTQRVGDETFAILTSLHLAYRQFSSSKEMSSWRSLKCLSRCAFFVHYARSERVCGSRVRLSIGFISEATDRISMKFGIQY